MSITRPLQLLRRAGSVAEPWRPGLAHRPHHRCLHNVPRLVHGDRYRSEGLPGFLSKEAFHQSWTLQQQWLVDQLNAICQGTSYEDMSPMDIVVKTSRSPEHAALFNYASMAYNNHFFFKSLTPDPAPIPDHLASKLGDSFSSPDSLRLEFLATANAMFGPGFVWLVSTGVSNQLRVLTTYLAGSPENNAHGRRQGRDQNTSSGLPARVATAEPGLGSVQLKTVICVSTWEHVWLGDYGVGGKREFLRRWWERVDWEAVGKNVGAHAGAGRMRGRIGGLGSPFAGL